MKMQAMHWDWMISKKFNSSDTTLMKSRKCTQVVEKSTNESLVSKYELKFSLVDSLNRVKEYTIVLKVEIPPENHVEEINSEYVVPIEEEIDEKE